MNPAPVRQGVTARVSIERCTTDCRTLGIDHLVRQAQMAEEMRRLALDARLPLSSLG